MSPERPFIDMILTLPDCCGWHDHLTIYVEPRGCTAFVYHVQLASLPVSRARLEDAQGHAARSLRAEDISARNELARRR